MASDIPGSENASDARFSPMALFWCLWIGITILLLVTRWDRLTWPPYYEQSEGLWSEAIYLYDTDFNYWSLLHDEKHTDQGGMRCYYTTLLPGFIAVMMKIFEETNLVLTFYHVFTFMSGSLILCVVYVLLSEVNGSIAGLLSTCALATMPLFSVQLDCNGMDVPSVAAGVLWALFLVKGRWKLALAMALLSFALKNSGVIFVASNVGYHLLRLAVLQRNGSLSEGDGGDGRHDRSRESLRGLLLGIVAFIGCYFVVKVGNEERLRFLFWNEIPLWIRSCPDLIIILLFSGVVTAISLIRGRSWHFRGIVVSGAARLLMECPIIPIAWLVILLNHAAMFSLFFEVRHQTTTAPFAILLLSASLFGQSRRLVALVTLSALIAFNLGNQYGEMFPALPTSLARGWGIPERSHEFEWDHQSNRQVCKLLEDMEPAPTLLVDQFIRLTALPQLGYVTFSLYKAGVTRTFATDQSNILDAIVNPPGRLVVTYVPSQMGELPFPSLCIRPPRKGDRILYDDRLRPPVVVYESIAPLGDEIDRTLWMMDVLFSQSDGIDAAVKLTLFGRFDLAAKLLQKQGYEKDARDELMRRLESTVYPTRLLPEFMRSKMEVRNDMLRDRWELLRQKNSVLKRIVPIEPMIHGIGEYEPQRVRFVRSMPRSTR